MKVNSIKFAYASAECFDILNICTMHTQQIISQAIPGWHPRGILVLSGCPLRRFGWGPVITLLGWVNTG